MPLSRRTFIRTLGGSGLVLGAGGFGLTRCDRMPDSAIAGWRDPGAGRRDVREWALAHALLAPNPHNLQPWLADLRVPDQITLSCDPDRVLPETDPFGRQILIGFGTFLEILEIAAREKGYRADITLFPEGAPSQRSAAHRIGSAPVARIRLSKDVSVQRSPLFRAIAARRSCKEPYDLARPLTEADAIALRTVHRDAAITLTVARDPGRAATLRKLTRDAMLLEMSTPRTLQESIDLSRIGADEIAANPDGIDLHGPMFWWLKRFGVMTKEKAMTPGTMAYQGGIDYAMGWSEATPSFGWLTTSGNSRHDQVRAGRAYVRLNLQATAQGVAMHPVSQLLQEYPEMTDLQRDFYRFAASRDGDTIQMLFRIGYAETPPPSPRRPLDALIRT